MGTELRLWVHFNLIKNINVKKLKTSTFFEKQLSEECFLEAKEGSKAWIRNYSSQHIIQPVCLSRRNFYQNVHQKQPGIIILHLSANSSLQRLFWQNSYKNIAEKYYLYLHISLSLSYCDSKKQQKINYTTNLMYYFMVLQFSSTFCNWQG